MKKNPETDGKINADFYCFDHDFMMSIDVSWNTYIDFEFEGNEKDR